MQHRLLSGWETMQKEFPFIHFLTLWDIGQKKLPRLLCSLTLMGYWSKGFSVYSIF